MLEESLDRRYWSVRKEENGEGWDDERYNELQK